MIARYFSNIERYLEPNKVLILYGPRRVGKTTLLHQYLARTTLKYRLDSGENIKIQDILSSQDLERLTEYAGDNELIAIDEAQQIPNIGMGLKMLVDHIPNIKIFVTGSSSFELSHQVGEPLVGRKRTLTLFPIAELELAAQTNMYDLTQSVEDRMIFGSYPDVITAEKKSDKITVIDDIVNSYLFKDALALDKIRKSKTLVDLVKLLALQIGSEVSLNEIATQLGVNVRTIEQYIDVLEKSFIIVGVGALRRNLQNEIRSKKKYYFYDTGIRNGVISRFNPLADRDDVGALWENFLVIERLKKRTYQSIHANYYFWRTYTQQEIDYIEERDGTLFAYEFKWGNTTTRPPASFVESYPKHTFTVVTKESYMDFVGA